jgi:hypothetical protein
MTERRSNPVITESGVVRTASGTSVATDSAPPAALRRDTLPDAPKAFEQAETHSKAQRARTAVRLVAEAAGSPVLDKSNRPSVFRLREFTIPPAGGEQGTGTTNTHDTAPDASDRPSDASLTGPPATLDTPVSEHQHGKPSVRVTPKTLVLSAAVTLFLSGLILALGLPRAPTPPAPLPASSENAASAPASAAPNATMPPVARKLVEPAPASASAQPTESARQPPESAERRAAPPKPERTTTGQPPTPTDPPKPARALSLEPVNRETTSREATHSSARPGGSAFRRERPF